jgi:SAM-dependent methyltransferase/uncharacterized protein YbaR (Trm112 family)
VCPQTRLPLALSANGAALVSASGAHYPIVDGVPDFVVLTPGTEQRSTSGDYYRGRADEYDRGNDAMFRMLLCEEAPLRQEMVEALRLSSGSRVLEVGCGTCRDTVGLLDRGATVYASDLSPEMIVIGRQRLREAGADFSRLHLFRSDAMQLPFSDGFFDAAFHFGGLNLFPDIAGALREMTRVVKRGGRVVAGDEGLGPWLSDTLFGKILVNSNPLFAHRAPLDKVPVNARDVTCRWILNGSFYLIAFEVGQGEPQLDLDLEFPGWRGGSHRKRYFGRLEGVSPQLRDVIIKQAASEGLSISAWLEQTLRAATGTK